MAFFDEIFGGLEDFTETTGFAIGQAASVVTLGAIESPAVTRQKTEQRRLQRELEASEFQKQTIESQAIAQRMGLLGSTGRRFSDRNRNQPAVDFSEAPSPLDEVNAQSGPLGDVGISGTF